MKAFCEKKVLVMTSLSAICSGTTNTNTQNDTSFCNFFKVFENFCHFLRFSSFRGQESSLRFDNRAL